MLDISFGLLCISVFFLESGVVVRDPKSRLNVCFVSFEDSVFVVVVAAGVVVVVVVAFFAVGVLLASNDNLNGKSKEKDMKGNDPKHLWVI